MKLLTKGSKMINLSYARLNRISLSEKPYRGSTNRFPLYGRKHNTKYFLTDEENGEVIFKVMYGWQYSRKSITAEEYAVLKKDGKNVYHDKVENTYLLWYRTPCEIGVVRSDDTFEFTAIGGGYYQGARKFLSDASHGYFNNDSRRGGMVFSSAMHGFYPIHKGMRVDTKTMKPTKDITIIGKSVDRKASKKLMAKHQDFFKIAETMCKAMTLESWLDTAKTIYLDHDIEDKGSKEILILAEAMKSSAPLDALVLYALGMDINGFRWKIKSPSSWHHHKDAIETFNAMKARLCKQIYKENENIFKTVTYEAGKVYPPNEWGYTLMVDGVEVEQYGHGV
jgi:hypothetical protein